MSLTITPSEVQVGGDRHVTIAVAEQTAGGPGVAEVQTLTPSLVPSGGSINLNGDILAIDAPLSASIIQGTLDSTLGGGVVVVADTNNDGTLYTVTWQSDGAQSLLTAPAWTGSTNSLVAGQNETQQIDFASVPASGTWTITTPYGTTAAVNYDDDAAAVQTALEALAGVGSGQVVVTGDYSTGFLVQYGGTLADQAIALLSADGSGLMGATNPSEMLLMY